MLDKKKLDVGSKRHKSPKYPKLCDQLTHKRTQGGIGGDDRVLLVLMGIMRKLDEIDKRIMARMCSNCGNFDIEKGGCIHCVSLEGMFTEVAPDNYCGNWRP